MPPRMTARPSEERTGRTIHKLIVRATAAAKKTSVVQGWPQARYGRGRLGSLLRKRKRVIAVNAKKIHPAKKNAVASHGERDAGARQDRDVESSESGDGHAYRQPDCASRTRERLHYVGSDVLRLRQRREWQSTEVNDIRQQVQTAHGEQSQDDGARNVLLGTENFFSQIAEVVETVVSPHGGNQRGQQSADRPQTERRGDRGPRFHCIVLAEQHARYDNHRDRAYLEGRQQHLDSAARTHVQVIDRRDRHNDQRRERLGRGEDKVVSPDVVSEQRGRNNRE